MPRRYSMDARNADAAARRQAMIDAAIDVLGDVGAHGLTMELVADRADMATRTLYNHFPTRDELIAEALATQLAVFRQDLTVEVPAEGPPRERLARFVEVLFRIYADQGRSLTTLLEHREYDYVASQAREMRAWRRRQLDGILRSAKGELRLPLAQAGAVALVLSNHASWRTLVEECGLTPAKAVATTVRALDGALFDPA